MKKHRKFDYSIKGFLIWFTLAPAILFSRARSTRAAPLPGEALFNLSPSYGAAGLAEWRFTNVEVGDVPVGYLGYKTINVIYPAEVIFIEQTPLPANWNITLASNSPGERSLNVYITNPGSNGDKATVKDFFDNSYFQQEFMGAMPSANAEVSVSVSERSEAIYVDANGAGHVYEFVDGAINWANAYNAALGRSYGGMRGYLATITSIDEQIFLFDSVSKAPGWLGGTRLLYANQSKITPPGQGNNIPGTYASYDNTKTTWYWACGPENGTPFYEGIYQGGAIAGVFSFFANAQTLANYPSYSSYITASGEPNNGEIPSEDCLQFAFSGVASWNDLSITRVSVTYAAGYYVEYGGDAPFPTNAIPRVLMPTPREVSFEVLNPDYNGPVPATQTVWVGEFAAAPGELIPGNMYPQYQVFIGWFKDLLDMDPFDFTKKIFADLTLYAKWETRFPPPTPTDPTPTEPPPRNQSDSSGAYKPPVAYTATQPPPSLTPVPDAPPIKRNRHPPYVIGYPGAEFHPDRTISRAETAEIFFNLIFLDDEFNNLDFKDFDNSDFNNTDFNDSDFDNSDFNNTDFSNSDSNHKTFLDVNDSDWYSRAINYLAQVNILDGYKDSYYRPGDSMTRAEFAAIAARYVNASFNGDCEFADVPENHWAREYICAARSKGWIEGYSDKTFRPDNLITRAEAVTLINRALGRGLPKKNVRQTMIYSDVSKNYWAYWDILESSRDHNCRIIGGAEDWEER